MLVLETPFFNMQIIFVFLFFSKTTSTTSDLEKPFNEILPNSFNGKQLDILGYRKARVTKVTINDFLK